MVFAASECDPSHRRISGRVFHEGVSPSGCADLCGHVGDVAASAAPLASSRPSYGLHPRLQHLCHPAPRAVWRQRQHSPVGV